MSSSSSSKKAILAVSAVAATAVAVGVAVAMKKKRKPQQEESDEEDTFTPSQLSSIKRKSATNDGCTEQRESMPTTRVAESAPATTASAVSKEETRAAAEPVKVTPAATLPAAVDSLLDEALEELEPKTANGAAAAPAPVGGADKEGSGAVGKSAVRVTADGRTVLPHLGLSIKGPSGWEIREELSPVPNVAIVAVWNPAFAEIPNADAPGNVPVIILSVEDIRGENLNLTEFKDRSKELSMQQMLMMTGGAIQPVVRKDTSLNVGPFRHVLEYAQSLPPLLDLLVVNLLEVRNGIAYVFQIMCSPKVMNEYRSVFMQLARDTVLTSLESSSLGYVKVCTGEVSVNIDTAWNWRYPATPSADGALATFELFSTVKKEEITLYRTEDVPQTAHKVRDTKTVDGVEITSAFDGALELKTASYNGYSLVVRPLQKVISYLPESYLVSAIKSVQPSSEPPKPKGGATFVTPEYGYCFDIIGGSRVVSTKLGNGTVVYAPLGVPQDITKELSPEEQGVTVTVRIGSPEDDPDCMATMEEWRARLQGEANVSNIQTVKMKGTDCLTFVSKEMQEVGQGQRVEVRGNVYIFVRDGVTTLLRWEAATGLFRKYERDMNAFLESFEFL